MKPKLADGIEVFLCEHCSAVHIGMWRGGKMFAEAIPDQPEAFLAELQEKIALSQREQAGQGRKQ